VSKTAVAPVKVWTRAELEEKIADRNARFRKLSAAERRVAIAWEVLDLLKARKFRAESVYFDTDDDYRYEAEAQETADYLPTCDVCALGSAMIAGMRLFDRAPQVPMHRVNTYEYVAMFFPVEQRRLMETAFEGEMDFAWRENSRVSEVAAERALAFGERFKNADQKLRAIMQNIIDNGGTFRP